MGSYSLREEAIADLERIWRYGVKQWGMERADAYYAAFFDHFEKLAENPRQYAEIDLRPGYRRSICGKDSVLYSINGDVVEIMAILGQQDTGEWL